MTATEQKEVYNFLLETRNKALKEAKEKIIQAQQEYENLVSIYNQILI